MLTIRVTWRMFALEPAPKSRPIPSGVILSEASRDLFPPEIAGLRFPGGTRSRSAHFAADASRRISPAFARLGLPIELRMRVSKAGCRFSEWPHPLRLVQRVGSAPTESPDARKEFNSGVALPNSELQTTAPSHTRNSRRMRTYAKRGRGVCHAAQRQ
jgi:hypothetical protein